MSKTVCIIHFKTLLAIPLILLMQANAFAEDGTYFHKMDSLVTLLEISPDRVKSKIYAEMSDLAMKTDTSLAKAYAVLAFEYADVYQARFDLSQSYYRLGRILYYQDSLELALYHVGKSLSISRENEDDIETGYAYRYLSGKSLFYKASIYHGIYPDSTKVVLKYLLAALEKLNGTNDYKMLANINQLLGRQYFEINIFDKGLEHFNKVLDYYEIIDEKPIMANIYRHISYRVDRATSIDYAQKSIELYAESGDSLGMARNLINISFNTREIIDPETNLGYLQLAYDIYEKHEYYPGMVYALFHLATYHGYHLGDSDTELRYLKKGAEISLRHHVVKSAGHIFITLGTYYKTKHQYDSAAYYLHIADSITAFMPGKPERIRYLIRMGDLLNATERYEEAEDYLVKALEQAQEIDDWQLINIAFLTLYRTFKNAGNFEKALAFFEQHRDLKNKMINQSTEGKIAELQIRYETDKMEHQIELMEKDRQLKNQLLRKNQITIISISGVMFLVLVFSGLIIRQLIKKRTAYNMLMEKNLQLIKCENPRKKKRNNEINNQPSIDPELQKQIISKLKYQIRHNKIYLKSELSLTMLAKKCQTNSSYLSKIIHMKYGSNFNGFINELRIKEAQKMMADESYRSYSIEGIATSVGFKTKSVFNVSFKKFTGLTPSYYLEYLNRGKTAPA
jgi:AraC-like DNA-binding protein